jgi:deoxyribodipyrimidine photolyase-related protein
MSNHCRDCRYTLKERSGPDACPLTVLYWDFLDRNRELLGSNRRMWMQMKNLDRIEDDELEEIRRTATGLRDDFSA